MTGGPENRVAHVIARAIADDPATLAVLALADALDGAEPGERVERVEPVPAAVFAASGATGVDGVEAIAQLPAERDALVVYHQSGAAPALVHGLSSRGSQLVVVHSDPAPGPLARRDLQRLASAGARGLATSDRAAARLHDIGFASVSRVPTVVAGDRIAAVDAFEPTVHHLDVSVHGPLVITVDELATAASAARVVQAFHVLRTYLTRAGHLAIAVPDSEMTSEAAVQTVYREVWGLRLTDAWAHRLVNRGERAALTRRATVFVTTDSAGGDVRNALAAMAEGVAVVAAADAGARELLGEGALVLPSDAGPALVAEAVAELLHDDVRRARFAAAGRDLVARFAPERVAPAWRAALAA